MLHKIKKLSDSKLDCLDGDVGGAADFLFDDQHWTIRYLVANTGHWLTGRQVLISPHALVAAIKDDETWKIRYLVVDTRNWWPGKHVLLSPEWIDRVSWNERKVFVNLPQEAIKEAPEFSKDQPITRDYESKLYSHYQRENY